MASNGAAGIPKIVNDVATVRARIDALGLSKVKPGAGMLLNAPKVP